MSKAKMTTKILMATLTLLLVTTAAEARMGVGNGDGIKLAFAKAREHAAFITLRINDRSLAKNLDLSLRNWILANNQELAADIAKTKHKWIDTATAACATTHLTTGAEIELSYPTCRQSLNSSEDAGMLLVHESVHHLDIADESFADAVALAIYGSWRTGGTDWVPSSKSGAPSARDHHSAVYANGEVIVFGGLTNIDSMTATNTGGRYDPIDDTWTALPTANVAPRFGHQAVWTGSQMIVWGGFVVKTDGSKVWQNNGAVYDARSNSWTTLRSPYGPYELADVAPDVDWAVQTLVWTGKEAIIYGGSPVSGKLPGGIYNPSGSGNSAWRSIATTNAPLRLAGHSAVWTEDRMIVFGGRDLAQNLTNAGASFDPIQNKWTALSQAGAPTARALQSAVWTGNAMVVFGGTEATNDLSGTGGVYSPATNSWKAFRTESVQARYEHTAVWTGSEMLVYGGRPVRLFRNLYFGVVGAFNPITMTWRTVEATSNPPARGKHAAAWTGSSMVIFGGVGDGGNLLNSGGVFYP